MECKAKAFLVLNGTFAPIHKNHISMLKLAKKRLEQTNMYAIECGFLCPTHDSNCKRKLGDDFMSGSDRLKMCELAIQEEHDLTGDSDWIKVFSYQIMQPKNPGAKKTLDELKRQMKDCLCISVFGIDSMELILPSMQRNLKQWSQEEAEMKWFNASTRAVCVINRACNIDINHVLENPDYALVKLRLLVVIDETQSEGISSTKIRTAFKQKDFEPLSMYLHNAVLDYYVNKIHSRHTNLTVGAASHDLGPKFLPLDSVCSIKYIDCNQFGKDKTENQRICSLEDLFNGAHGKCEKVGKGCAGDVYCISESNINTILNQPKLAIKLCDLSNKAKKLQTRLVEAFKREIVINDKLNSNYQHDSHIVQSFGYGYCHHTSKMYMIMQYFNQGNLTSYLLKNQLMNTKKQPVSEIPSKILEFKGFSYVEILLQIATGMMNISRSNILHRDLSLDNIFLDDNDGRVEVAVGDFSASQPVNHDRDIPRGSMRRYAPEAIDKRMKPYYTTAADVYMFGVIMWELMHGCSYFFDLGIEAAIQLVLQGTRPPLPNDCPLWYHTLCFRCLHEDFRLRPAFHEIVAEIMANK